MSSNLLTLREEAAFRRQQKELKSQSVLRMNRLGWTQRKIAQSLHLDERFVRRVLARSRQEAVDGQPKKQGQGVNT